MTLTVPNVVFKTRVRDESIGGDNPFRWQDVSTDDIFKGKKLFSEPGKSDDCPDDPFTFSGADTMLDFLKKQ